MKYLFFIAFVAASFGGFWYYGEMKSKQAAERETLTAECQAEVLSLLERADSVYQEYEQAKTKLNELEEKHDSDIKKLHNEARLKVSELLTPAAPPANATANIKRRHNNLTTQISELREQLANEQRRHQQLEKDLLKRIRDNQQAAQQKAAEAKRKLAGTTASVNTKARHKQELDSKLASMETSLQNVNATLRKSIEESRAKYEKIQLDSIQSIEKLKKQIAALYATNRQPQQSADNDATEIGDTLVKLGTDLKRNRIAFIEETKKLNNDLNTKHRQFNNIVKKAEEADAATEIRLAELSTVQEQHLLYARIIFWGVAIILALATYFVFVGSRKVKESPGPYH